MKYTILCLLGILHVSVAWGQSAVEGRVVNSSNEPVMYANIILLNGDSLFMGGSISDNEGRFSLQGGADARFLKVSSIGYKEFISSLKSLPGGGDIKMEEDTTMLNEVVVKGDLPKTRLKGNAMVTDVENSLLSGVGSANDVLEHIPGITRKNDVWEVLGKGSPLIYVNGRQIRDLSELEGIHSGEIRSVELITNPGSRYDATVKSVVRIHLTQKRGDGLGLNLRSSYYQSRNTDLVEQLDLRFQHDNLYLFGTLYYMRDNSWMKALITQDNQVENRWIQKNQSISTNTSDYLRSTFGFNYQIGKKHAVGMKYDLLAYPRKTGATYTISDVFRNAEFYDHWTGAEMRHEDYTPSHRLNAYYEGGIGNVETSLNIDYFKERKRLYSATHESSQEQDNREIRSENPVDNQLVAAKLVFTLPAGGGNLSWGSEFTYTSRTDDYLSDNTGYVPTSLSEIKESNMAVFAEYYRNFSFGQLSAGIRYEHVNFDYYHNRAYMRNESKKYDNFFPNLSLAKRFGSVQTQLSYTAKARRPDYYFLSNNITYLNRFTLKQGDPTLRPSLTHDLSLSGAWRFLQLMVSYQRHRDLIMAWGKPQGDHSEVTLIYPINFKRLPQVSAFLSASPKIGIWSPTWTIGVVKQWMSVTSQDNTFRLERPIWSGSFDNQFLLPWDLVLMVDFSYQSKGYMQNAYSDRHIFVGNVSIRRSFLDDALSVELRGKDLWNRNWNSVVCYYDRLRGMELDKYDNQEFSVTIRYKFNAIKNKYKGSGAGRDALNRL